ncbi:MAG: glycosyltransferase family 39 protein [Candidatus Omnitrophica bacterium]|nr:glycosyltransferase family 39 protein [Candidatus Omnitrophota bacterium]
MKKENSLHLVIVLICFIFIFLMYLSLFDGPISGYWDSYITAPALFMTNTSIDFTSKEGESLYAYSLPGRLPDNLVNHTTYGIITKDQRIGSAIICAPFTLFFNQFGFRLLYALVITLISLFMYLAIYQIIPKFGIALCTSLIATLNSYLISIHTLNPNVIGMFFISLLLYLLVLEKKDWFLIGILFGILGGVRNVAILFAPAFIFKLLTNGNQKKKNCTLFFAGALIAILPILYWKQYAYGNIFIHPSQFSHHEGFRPAFEHSFLFWKFKFNGMFNFPFHEKIVRTPYFPFPTFLTLPLTIISSLGIILTSLMVTGFFYSFKRNKKEALFLILWFLPMYSIFVVQENWSELKTSFLLLFINPPLFWVAFGCDMLFEKHARVYRFCSVIVVSIILVIAVKLLSFFDCEVDGRWYERFPRALKKEMSFVGDDLRSKPESTAELMAQKKQLTKGNLFPIIAVTIKPLQNVFSSSRDEIKKRKLYMIDYWKYIYEDAS